MSDAPTLFAALRESADKDAAAAIERLVDHGADGDLNRINALDFAARSGLDEEA
ncbi:MAG: adenylate/guanylate cyclase domain-containing protein, partial [Alphaproteobacteria bacterium]|nr:adenylate/guanylate cyclase domain-containing protein [Alphaproteobacteria bacterium]